MLQCCITILARLDLEASQNPDPFPARAYRDDLRCVVEAALGKRYPSPYVDA